MILRSTMSIALGLWLAIVPATSFAAHAAHRRHRHVAPRADVGRSSQPDCRYPDGTPFDPDIIGGPNHVGDGGPAVNLGGVAPCGY